MEIRISDRVIRLVRGDITAIRVDAIVNAANSGLMGGGGVDGAIHWAGGPAILEECRRIVERLGRLPAGRAVITTGGMLPAGHVIHAVGPVWKGGGRGEAALLASAYKESLRLAQENAFATVAFPSISTGAYGYPVEEAAAVALCAVADQLRQGTGVREVTFVLFDEGTYAAYARAAESLRGKLESPPEPGIGGPGK